MKNAIYIAAVILVIPALCLAQPQTGQKKMPPAKQPAADEVQEETSQPEIISAPAGKEREPAQSELITAPVGKKLEPAASEFVTSKVTQPKVQLAEPASEEKPVPQAPLISVGGSTREIELPAEYSGQEETAVEGEESVPLIKTLDDAKSLP